MITVAGVEYVTADEFAAAARAAGVDLHPRHVYDWTRRGLLSPVRLGRGTVYPIADLWRVERDTRRGRGRRRAHLVG